MRLLPLLCFALLAAVLGWQLSDGSGKHNRNIIQLDPLVGKPLPDFSLPLLGDSESELSPERFKGKPRLLNIMASWCGPCRAEHTLLRDYAESRLIPIYGIAWKDKPQDTAAFLQEMGNIYAEVGMDERGEAAIALGVTGVPETYLIDAEGKVAFVYRGALTRDVLLEQFDPVLRTLRGER